MNADSPRDRFLHLLRTAVADGSLLKLTLGKPGTPEGPEAPRNLFVRPVALKAGPHLALVTRYATRDVTKNLRPDEACVMLTALIGREFLDAHLFTPLQTAQLETKPDGSARLHVKTAQSAPPAPAPGNDRAKPRLIPPDAVWMQKLGVTQNNGQPRPGMTGKYRQIEKFAEVLSHLLAEAHLANRETERPLDIVDMGAGKGYLTFTLAHLLGERARITGVEQRADLVAANNALAREQGFSNLTFIRGSIAETQLERIDVLIALHACDTATDDALFMGLSANARLLVVSPCCQKELRPQLTAPPVLADALRHGIFQERQAEFVTDALRAQLLEYAGFSTRVFEFVSPDHTARNVMISAIRERSQFDSRLLERLRQFATFYGVAEQRLAQHLGVSLQRPGHSGPDRSEPSSGGPGADRPRSPEDAAR